MTLSYKTRPGQHLSGENRQSLGLDSYKAEDYCNIKPQGRAVERVFASVSLCAATGLSHTCVDG